MVARGAKATDTELQQIVEYLALTSDRICPPFPAWLTRVDPAQDLLAALSEGSRPLGGGAADSHVVDNPSADRGKSIYIAECITCHGKKGRGGMRGLPRDQQGFDPFVRLCAA